MDDVVGFCYVVLFGYIILLLEYGGQEYQSVQFQEKISPSKTELNYSKLNSKPKLN